MNVFPRIGVASPGRPVPQCRPIVYFLFIFLTLPGIARNAHAMRPDILWMRGGHNNVTPLVTAFSPDGRVLAATGGDAEYGFDPLRPPSGAAKTIKIWSLPENRLVRTFQLPSLPFDAQIQYLGFSPDGKVLGVQCYKPRHLILLLRVSDGHLLRTVQLPLRTPDKRLGEAPFFISPDNRYLLVSGSAATFVVRVSDGSILHAYEENGNAVLSPGGDTLAVMEGYTGSRPIHIYPLSGGPAIDTVLPRVQDPADRISFQYAADGLSLYVTEITSGDDVEVGKYRIGDGAFLTGYRLPAIGISSEIHFTRDRKLLTSVYHEGSYLSLGLWDAEGGTFLRKITGLAVWSTVDFSPDGQTLLTQEPGGNLNLWRVSDGRPLTAPDLFTIQPGDSIKSMGFTPEGALGVISGHILYMGTEGQAAVFYGNSDGEIRYSTPYYGGFLQDAAFSKDYRFFITGNGSIIESSKYTTQRYGVNEVDLWSIPDGKELQRLIGHTGNVLSVDVSPDGKTVASGSGDQPTHGCFPFGCIDGMEDVDRTVRLWNVEDGRTLHTLTGHKEEVTGVAFSPDGTLLASGDKSGAVLLWNVADGSLLRTLPRYPAGVRDLYFSPDGSRLGVLSADQSLLFYSVRDGQTVGFLPAQAERAAFSPDGSLLATSDGGSLQVRDGVDGRLIARYDEEAQGITGISISADNRLLSNSRSDGVLAVIDLPTAPVILGDVNRDGGIDVGDAVSVLASILQLQTLSEIQHGLADADGNGAVDVRDAILVLQVAAGFRADLYPHPPRPDPFSSGLSPVWKAKQYLHDPPKTGAGDGVLLLTSAGHDVWREVWEPFFVYQDGIYGDFTMQMKVDEVPGCSDLSAAGLMVAAGVPDRITGPSQIPSWAAVLATRDYGTEAKWGGGGGSETSFPGTIVRTRPPFWLRLDRSGNTLTFYNSGDGIFWSPVGDSVDMGAKGWPLTDPISAGIVEQTHCGHSPGTAQVSHFRAGPISQAGRP